MTAAMFATCGVFAKKVAFVVDMTGQTVGAAGVHVAGNFQGWSANTSRLFPVPGVPNNYGMLFDINAGQVIEFKIINGDAFSAAEAVPDINRKGYVINNMSDDNRWMYIDSLKNDTTVINVKFASSAPTGKTAIRFTVDLQKESAVSSNGVYIAGNFQDINGASGEWKPNETRMSNLYSSNKIYEYIAYVGTTDMVEFKYLNGNDWPQNESVPSGCAQGGNRYYQATSTSTALPKVCFGSCTACPAAPIPTFSYMFQVDMSNSNCDGGFDSVTVAGAGAKLTGFGAGLKMNQVGTTGVYELTVANLDSGEVNFKYRFHKNGNTNWEGGDNRILPLTKNDTTRLTCFGSRVVGACPSKPLPSNLTFIVDFTGAGAPPPAAKIFLIGDFTKPQWQAGAKELTQIVGKPGVYSVTIDSICPGKVSYKFTNGDAINQTNEENYSDTTQRTCVEANGVGGFNRTFVRTVATPVTISYQWNKCVAGFVPGTSVSEVLANNVKLYPNPTNDYSVLAFNDNATSHNVSIVDIAGKVVRTYSNYELATLKIERNELKAGIYFVNVVNSNNQTATMKLMIQE